MKRPPGGLTRKQLVFLGIGALALGAFCWIWQLHQPEHHWGLMSGFCLLGGAAVGHAWALGSHGRFAPTAVDMVHLLQWQRHDFLNHLQVVSALAQLNKPERILEYIASASQDLNRERALTGLLPAEAGLVLLDWCHRLQEAGVAVQVDLKTDLSRLANGGRLAALLLEILTALLAGGWTVQEVALRSFQVDEAEALKLTVRTADNPPWPHLARLQELARSVPTRLKIERAEAILTLTLLFAPAAVMATPRVGTVKS